MFIYILEKHHIILFENYMRKQNTIQANREGSKMETIREIEMGRLYEDGQATN